MANPADPFTPLPLLLDTLVEEEVKRVVDALVVAHRNGTLEPQAAVSGIAQIAALRSLPSSLARRIKQHSA